MKIVERMVAASWRQQRAIHLEKEIIDLKLQEQQREIVAKFEVINHAARTAIAYTGACNVDKTLASLQMGISGGQQFGRALRDLEKVRKIFAAQSPPEKVNVQNEPKFIPEAPRSPPLSNMLAGDSVISNMNRRTFLGSLATAALASGAQASPKPNIIVILADDMGFSDLGCYGSEIATPNLNALAQGGVRSTHFRNTARCCPTRAALLTGLYSHQAAIGHMIGDYGVPGYRGDLSHNAVTIAEALKLAQYSTAMIGKWHVTPPDPDKRDNWPRKRGFDYAYSTIVGSNHYFQPHRLIRNDDYIQPSGDYYYTDALSDEAVGYIQRQKNASNPFFMYLAYTAPHWPLQARDEDIKKYSGRYAAGWDHLRAERYQRMVDTGVIDKKWGISPRDAEVPAWDTVPDKEWQQRRMEVYAAQIECMDRGIGRVMEALKASGAEDNTLVLFMSDNGGCAEVMKNTPNAGYPAKTLAGETVVWGNRPDVMPGPATTFQSYGPEWPHLSNTPFRMYKHWVHEGGIASPLIARWPRQFKERGGWTHQAGHVIDIMATCLDAAGASYPKTYQGRAITPLAGQSLLPSLRQPKRITPRILFWEHEGNRAVVDGDWKLVAKHAQPWELYNLADDRIETKDLAAAQPARVKKMEAQYLAWASRSQVTPWDELKRS